VNETHVVSLVEAISDLRRDPEVRAAVLVADWGEHEHVCEHPCHCAMANADLCVACALILATPEMRRALYELRWPGYEYTRG